MRSAGRVVTRSRVMESVWRDRNISGNNLDVFIRFLRAKVDRPDLPRLLHTQRGSDSASGRGPIEGRRLPAAQIRSAEI